MEALERVFANNLRSLRRAKGWTQADLAAESGVSLRAISDMESGTRLPRRSNAQAISAALGVSPDDLFKAPDEKPPAAPEVLQKIEALIQLSPNEAELLRMFRSSSPTLQGAILDTVRRLIEK